jgi:hypothetical protein
MVKHEDRSGIGVEAVERSLQRETIGDSVVRRDRSRAENTLRCGLDRELVYRCAPPSTGDAAARVNEDACRPRFESGGIPQARQRSPDRRKCLLHRVPGVRLVADDRHRRS